MELSVCAKTKKIKNLTTGLSSKSPLANSEISILKLLISDRLPHSREEISDAAWDRPVGENSLNVAINNLRRAFFDLGVTDFILTIRGFGYEINNDIDIHIEFDELQGGESLDMARPCDKGSCEYYRFYNKRTDFWGKIMQYKSFFYFSIYALVGFFLFHYYFFE